KEPAARHDALRSRQPPASSSATTTGSAGDQKLAELVQRLPHSEALRQSGKEVLSPAPPPLRTARAPFDASSSSIEQRPCEIRPGSAPPADDTPYGTRSPHWPWGRPERYYGIAGYRDDLRWRL